MTTLDTPVSQLRGVGPAREKALAAAGIFTLGDAIRYLPRAYQNRGDIHRLHDEEAAGDNVPHGFLVTVASEPVCRMIRRGMTVLKFRVFDDSGTAEVTYFNQPYLKDAVHTGAELRLFGKLSRDGSVYKLTSPILEAAPEGADLPALVPVYPLVAGLTQKFVAGIVAEAFRRTSGVPLEFLPPALTVESGLASERFALENIHFPANLSSLAAAKKRLVYDELCTVAAAMGSRSSGKASAGAAPMKKQNVAPFFAALPYELTGAQKRAIADIAADMASERPMNRIVTGDVGSGKTAVAAAAAYLALDNGYTVALMAPTEILAAQHARDLGPLMAGLGYRVALLTGSLTAAEKRRVRASLAEGQVDFVIGTHALLSEDTVIPHLGLVITDEQHRFGVLQRAALAEKSAAVHSLFMSATPIPRTLSLVAYGDLSLSRIDEMPPGRQKVETFVVDESYRARLNRFIRKQAAGGHQTYVVCPAVEEIKERKPKSEDPEEAADVWLLPDAEGFSEAKPPLKAAVTYAAELARALPELRIGFVHGKLKPAEKDDVMSRFCRGELDVLVSTTVIEVGVNVPSATLMIVENADRFGLSQLHQLRGRVGRGRDQSYCVLVSDATGETATRRLRMMKSTTDGFAIAQEDLAIRGPGDFWAMGDEVRQSGSLRLTLAAGCTDEALIEKATAGVRGILDRDPHLTDPENEPLRRRAEALDARVGGTSN